MPDGYNPQTIWDGLNVIPFSIAVHFESDHPESHLTDKEIQYYKDNNIPFKTLRDGEVLIIEDDSIEKII